MRTSSLLLLLSLPLLLALPCAPTAANDPGDGALAAAEWEAAKAWLFAPERVGGLDEASLEAFAEHLTSATPDELEALTQTREVWQMPDERRVPFEHALRSLAWLRRLDPHLERGPRVALLLGRREGRAWEEALVELCREPFGEPLGRAARVLSKSPAGPLRAMAGVLAKYLNAFCGGRSTGWSLAQETAWDPTPLAREIAARLLDDPNPAVACRFITYEAYDFQDPWMVDALVARLRDPRQRPTVRSGLLHGLERTVAEACIATLHTEFDFRRKPSAYPRSLPRNARFRCPHPWAVAERPQTESADAIETFWHRVRERWSFVPDGEAWRKLLDVSFALQPGATRTFTTPFGDLVATLHTYAEGFDSLTGPSFTIQVDLDLDDGGQSWNSGNPSHHLGFVAGGVVGGGVWEKTSLLFAPKSEEGVRMRLRIWTTRTPKSGDAPPVR